MALIQASDTLLRLVVLVHLVECESQELVVLNSLTVIIGVSICRNTRQYGSTSLTAAS